MLSCFAYGKEIENTSIEINNIHFLFLEILFRFSVSGMLYAILKWIDDQTMTIKNYDAYYCKYLNSKVLFFCSKETYFAG